MAERILIEGARATCLIQRGVKHDVAFMPSGMVIGPEAAAALGFGPKEKMIGLSLETAIERAREVEKRCENAQTAKRGRRK